MRICQKGEQKYIGATLTLINYGGKNIVVDSGIGFENNGEIKTKTIPSGNFLKGTRVDVIIITHSHLDHIGTIPRLVAEHPEAFIFISRPAYRLAEIMLNDSLRIYRSEHRAKYNSGLPYDILFDDNDLYGFLNSEQIDFIDEPCWIDTVWPGWSFGFYWAGHAVGAMMIMISAPGEPPLHITGDIASHDQEIVPGVMLPPEESSEGFFNNPDLVMVTEGTNGAKKKTLSRNEIKNRLIETVFSVRKRGGTTFFPAFAQTKSSNLVMICLEAGLPVHIDGLVRQIAPIEIPNFNELVAGGKITVIEDGEEGAYHRELLARGQDPCGHEAPIVISPNGALEPSCGTQHAEYILPGTRNAIIFTGYTFPDSVAKQILEIERGRTINLRTYKQGKYQKVSVNVRCDVHHFDLTSHDYSEALVERVRRIRPKDVCIHHCDKKSFDALTVQIAALERPPRINWLRHERELKF